MKAECLVTPSKKGDLPQKMHSVTQLRNCFNLRMLARLPPQIINLRTMAFNEVTMVSQVQAIHRTKSQDLFTSQWIDHSFQISMVPVHNLSLNSHLNFFEVSVMNAQVSVIYTFCLVHQPESLLLRFNFRGKKGGEILAVVTFNVSSDSSFPLLFHK